MPARIAPTPTLLRAVAAYLIRSLWTRFMVIGHGQVPGAVHTAAGGRVAAATAAEAGPATPPLIGVTRQA